MKVRVSRAELVSALKVTSRLAVHAPFDSVKLSTSHAGLCVEGRSGELYCRLVLPCEEKAPGSVCVPTRMADIVAGMKSSHVLLESSKPDSTGRSARMRITGDGARKFNVHLMHDTWDNPVNEEPEPWLSIPCNFMRKLLGWVLYVIPWNAGDRWDHTCALLHVDDERTLHMVATDGVRLSDAYWVLPEEHANAKATQVVISRDTVDLLQRLVPVTEPSKMRPVQVSTNNMWVRFTCDNWTIWSLALGTPFPSTWREITDLPEGTPAGQIGIAWTIDTMAAMQIDGEPVDICLDKGKLSVQAHSVRIDAWDEFDCIWTGPKLCVSVNPQYMIDALKTFEQPFFIGWFEGPAGRIAMRPDPGSRDLAVIHVMMPILKRQDIRR